jgi:hypothetical protein
MAKTEDISKIESIFKTRFDILSDFVEIAQVSSIPESQGFAESI